MNPPTKVLRTLAEILSGPQHLLISQLRRVLYTVKAEKGAQLSSIDSKTGSNLLSLSREKIYK